MGEKKPFKSILEGMLTGSSPYLFLELLGADLEEGEIVFDYRDKKIIDKILPIPVIEDYP